MKEIAHLHPFKKLETNGQISIYFFGAFAIQCCCCNITYTEKKTRTITNRTESFPDLDINFEVFRLHIYIIRKTFSYRFVLPVFARNLLRGSCRRNIFFFFSYLWFWCLTWDTDPGLTPNALPFWIIKEFNSCVCIKHIQKVICVVG